MRARSAVVFVLLGLLWGSAFLWIAIAVNAGTSPWTISCGRLLLGAVTVAGFIACAPERIRAAHAPAALRPWIGPMVVLGLLMGVIPFTALGYGERTVSSGVAAIFMAVVPLWTILIALTGVRGTAGERVGTRGAVGLLGGFAGVALLVGGDTGENDIAGDLLILGATIAYACGGLYARRLAARGIPPLAGPLGVGLMGGLICLPACLGAFATGNAPDPASLGAIAALGFGCTGIAYLLYFELNRDWGAARASSVTYLIPVVGVVLGVVFLGEDLGPAQLGGLVLVMAGVLVANGRLPGRRRREAADASRVELRPAASTSPARTPRR